jgi:MFS family permease
MLALAVGEVSLKSHSIVLSITSAIFLGLVGAGISAQFVLVVRSRLEKQRVLRDATTTVFGTITLMYSFGGLVGLLGGAQLSKGHGTLSSTFLVAALIALVGGLCAVRGTVGLD